MKIECKNKRDGGSLIDIGGTEYHFKPLADGAHVADVANEEHAERFLSIPEAYGIYRVGQPVDKEPAAKGPHVDSAVAATKTPEGAETTPPANVKLDDIAGDLDALKASYKERFGKAAHRTWTAEAILEKLRTPSE